MALGTGAALALGAAGGLLKNEIERSQAAADRKKAGKANKYSVWTGKSFDYAKDPSLVNNLLQGAALGGMMGGLGSAATGATADAGLGALEGAKVGMDGTMLNQAIRSGAVMPSEASFLKALNTGGVMDPSKIVIG
jgi:hypothetical protein